MGKQVKTPRFYVDMPTFLHATGDLKWNAELLYMNPSNPKTQLIEESGSYSLFSIGDINQSPKTSFPINFVALLNHNLGSNTNEFRIVGNHGFDDVTSPNIYPTSEILNANHTSEYLLPQYNGTTIFEFTSDDEYWKNFEIFYDADNFIDTGTHQLGSFVVGKYFDCPNSPDLSLTMSRRFDGIKRQKTIGGKTLANIYYDGPTEWTMNHPIDNDLNGTYKYPQFELDTTAQVDTQGYRFDYRAKSGLGRKGLRSWNLTFSYISEDDMWMDNEVSSKLIADNVTDDDSGNANPNPMLTDDSFNFVWNCTLGGTLPFIFQPDNTNNNPDQFSICTFRDNTLSVKQVAFNTYSLSITIDEVA